MIRADQAGVMIKASARSWLLLQPRRSQQRPCRACSAKTLAAGRTQQLREVLAQPGCHQGPACYDALTARLVEQAGFKFAFSSGFGISAARLGMPDAGLTSYSEMVDQGRNMHEATEQIPIIGDGDTGWGNAGNVRRTVQGYAAAGFAGILIEDQAWPKSCGHVTHSKQVVGREEAVMRITAAVDARDALQKRGQDLVVVARSDARQADSLEEALWRVNAFASAGADVLFIDALSSEREVRAFGECSGAAACVPKMASMLEGGGRTPVIDPSTLAAMGYRLVAYPLSLLAVSVKAQQRALQQLKGGSLPEPASMATFADLQQLVGFPEYWEHVDRYRAKPASSQGSNNGESM